MTRLPVPSTDADGHCPSCGATAIVVGTLEHRPARFFVPTGLRFWTLGAAGAPVTRAPRLPGIHGLWDQRGLQGCMACGLVWTRVDAERLRTVIEGAGTPELRARLAAARADGHGDRETDGDAG